MRGNWINGRNIASSGSDAIEVVDPATEVTIDAIPRGTSDDIDAAVVAAGNAQRAWADLSPTNRLVLLDKALVALGLHRETIASMLTQENGKPLAKARSEVDASIRVLRSYMELAVHLRSGGQSAPNGELVFQQREARGVAACITPWNFPILAGFEVVVPNIVVGNTVVWKPSEKTPLSSRFIAEHVFGTLPPGVVNLVMGDGPAVGVPLVRHAAVDVVCFIGSEATGRRIGSVCGEALKKCVLELGGNDAMIVDETASPSDAARLAALAAFENSGQICTSTERIYVHSSIADTFVQSLVAEADKLRVGSGFDPNSQLGPLIDADHLRKVSSHVDDAVAQGAVVRGNRLHGNSPGYFYRPTVLTNVDHGMIVMSEETFGPIAPVMVFDDFEHALQLANESRFGLSAIVCSESSPRAIKALQTLRAGMVKINTLRGKAPGATSEPFGASGVGHGYGVELLQELTRQKSVHWKARLIGP